MSESTNQLSIAPNSEAATYPILPISFLTLVFRTLLIATFALWFGGFTFYVSFVVPIGTDVLGSARRQGFITQQVTHWLNLVCFFATVMMLLESISAWKRSVRPWREIQLGVVLLIGGLLGALVWIHPMLDSMIDAQKKIVSDKAEFYGLHRIYLWLSTFQWIGAWFWLPILLGSWSSQKNVTQPD